MEPNDILAYLNKKGYIISRMTLLRYEKEGLLPAAQRKSLGRGKGGQAEYPEGAEVEVLVACTMLRGGYKKRDVAEARIQAKDLLDNFFVKQITEFKDLSKTAVVFFKPADKKVFAWIMTWAKAKEGINNEDEIIYFIQGKPGSTATTYDFIKSPQGSVGPFSWEDSNYYEQFGSYFMFINRRVDVVSGVTTTGLGYGYYNPDFSPTVII